MPLTDSTSELTISNPIWAAWISDSAPYELVMQAYGHVVPIAQSVEQRTFNPWVDGSRPSGPTIFFSIVFQDNSECIKSNSRFDDSNEAYTRLMASSNSWVITGGAGYIGSHIADVFLAHGKEVVIFDSLKSGPESRVSYLSEKHNKKIPFVLGDIRNQELFSETLLKYKPDGIIHSAALKSVQQSFENYDEYMDVNVRATQQILYALKKHEVSKFIFSSSAAVYGSPNSSEPIQEDSELNPISPYGASKVAAENEVNKFLSIPGNQGSSLRFFNVVGSDSPELSDNSVSNLIPIIINCLKSGSSPTIFGTDYSTPDGTCVRDYVDVRDIAMAHLLVANSVKKLPPAMNVGTGVGVSVEQIIGLIGKKLGFKEVIPILGERRAGDPSILSANVSLIKEMLGYESKYSIESSLDSLK